MKQDSSAWLIDTNPPAGDFRADVLAGLSRPAKRLPCKYLYDARGSELFDRICELEEYYPTRTELGIMREHAAEMAELIGPASLLIEYGSGSSIKTRLLLDRLERPAGYAPVDVSREHLLASSRAITREYPCIPVIPICADFTRPYSLPPSAAKISRRVVYFPGSTIGNFPPPTDFELLCRIADSNRPGGGLLIGIDLQKSVEVIEAAYNDAQGVTAAFNLNLLAHINRELGGTFDLSRFSHRAFYDTTLSRVEMHLVSLVDQTVSVGGRKFTFREGEMIHTESSCKYTLDGFSALAARAGFETVRVWIDADKLFAVVWLELRQTKRR